MYTLAGFGVERRGFLLAANCLLACARSFQTPHRAQRLQLTVLKCSPLFLPQPPVVLQQPDMMFVFECSEMDTVACNDLDALCIPCFLPCTCSRNAVSQGISVRTLDIITNNGSHAQSRSPEIRAAGSLDASSTKKISILGQRPRHNPKSKGCIMRIIDLVKGSRHPNAR